MSVFCGVSYSFHVDASLTRLVVHGSDVCVMKTQAVSESLLRTLYDVRLPPIQSPAASANVPPHQPSVDLLRGIGTFRKVGRLIGTSPLSSPPLTQKLGSLSQLWGLGRVVNSPRGVWGITPAENEFGAVKSCQKATGGNHFEYSEVHVSQ